MEKKARKAELNKQLKKAVVEHIGTEANDFPSWDVGTYSVFVPGAFREQNLVKAKNEKEAIQKVKFCLEQKIELMPDEIGELVEVKPDNLKMKTSSKLTFKEQ